MKRRIFILGSLIALLGTTATVVAPAQTSAYYTSYTPIRRQNREHYPEMRRALISLQQARDYLQHGARHFAGHRARAAVLVDQAIREIQRAIQYDQHARR